MDCISGEAQLFRARRVVNCAGPWCREVAEDLDREVAELFRPSLAFNVLFDRPPLGPSAVAVESPVAGARTYFIVPWNGKMMAGTWHQPWDGDPAATRPPSSAVEAFIDELNLAVPGLELTLGDVRRVYAGQLPAARAGTAEASTTPVLHDHGRHGGPRGLVSVSGVKWTTARDVVRQALLMTHGNLPDARDDAPPRPLEPERLSDMGWAPDRPDELLALCKRLVEEESVVWLDDLLLRRMEGLDSDAALTAAVDAGLRVMQGRGIPAEKHLARLVGSLESRYDKSAGALGSGPLTDPTADPGESSW
ncbi:MAG: FAD-dependent oxidoreductase [Gemmatimonadetes bacterium]|nr:FAD-dependent oxidoreductase [Gemmatimonadota bacterium]